MTTLTVTTGSRVGAKEATSPVDSEAQPGLDIIIPAHNEALRIGPTLEAFRRGFPHANTRFVVALDDCEDATADIVRRHARKDPRVEVHAYAKLGKGGVIQRAFEVCRGEVVAFVDADGSTSPSELARLVEAAAFADGAIASRRLPDSAVLGRRTFARTAASSLFSWMVRRLFGLPYRDTQCGAKVMRRQALERLLPHVTTRDLLFDVDLLLRAAELDLRVVEVPTVWVERPGSKVGLVADLGQVIGSLLRLWLDHRRREPSRSAAGGVQPGTWRAADVVLVSSYPPPGRAHGATSGVSAYTADLARSLTELGVGVAVVAPDEPGSPPTHADGAVTVVRSGPKGAFALSRSLRIAARMNPEVIHLQHEMFLFGSMTSMATLPLAVMQMRRAAAKAVTTVHQVLDTGQVGPDLMRLHRIPGPAAAARLVIAGYQRLMAATGPTIVHEDRFAPNVSNAVVIPHGVPAVDTMDRNRARRILDLAEERRLVVLCFGFVAPYKGLETALAAAARVPEIWLVVAGGDHPRHGASYSGALRHQWGGVADFTGWVPDEDVAAWHAAADLSLSCYPAPHSSSGALAMALAHGTPVLAGGALAEAMGLPAEMAVSLEGNDLADRLRRLAVDDHLLADLRRVSAIQAAGRSWSDVADRHLRLYRTVTDGAFGAAGTPQPGQFGQLEVA